MSPHAERISRLRHALRQEDADLLLVSDSANATYLTGFRGDSSYLLVGQDHLWLITDSRYTEQAQAEAAGCIVVQRKDSLVKEAAKVVESAAPKRLAFEEAQVTYSTYRELVAEFDGRELVPKKDLVESLRRVKDEGEIERIRKAAAAADAAFRDLRAQIEPGMTEREAASRLEFAMQQHGARRPSFDSIVAARARASLPHAEATDAVIQPGDPVLVDWGAVCDLYCSDATRMLFLAPPDERWREIYAIVLAAQERAIAEIRDGVSSKHVDAAARDTIAQAGHGDHFGHGLGHGVGLRVHEAPALSQKEDHTLAEGMVVTVEPGIYLPGWGGVRIEDLVCVRKEGAEILTSVPKTLDAAILT